jgi:hypothetical protein
VNKSDVEFQAAAGLRGLSGTDPCELIVEVSRTVGEHGVDFIASAAIEVVNVWKIETDFETVEESS